MTRPISAPSGGIDAIQPLRATIKGVAALVAPTTLVTALLYYFGWARTSTQAAVMGFDDSLLGFSPEDYLLRSIDPMFWPMFVGVAATIVGLGLHSGLVRRIAATTLTGGGQLRPAGRTLVRRASSATAAAGTVLLVLGVAGVNVERPSRVVSLWSPVCVTAAIILLAYAAYLADRFLGNRTAHEPPLDPTTEPSRDPRFWGISLVVLLVLLTLFWSVARYAEIKGIDLGIYVEEHLDERPDAVIYSERRLHLPAGVAETELAPDDGRSAFRYRYSGLKLLFRSGDRVFLRPSDPPVSRVNVIVAEGPGVRFEFARDWHP